MAQDQTSDILTYFPLLEIFNILYGGSVALMDMHLIATNFFLAPTQKGCILRVKCMCSKVPGHSAPFPHTTILCQGNKNCSFVFVQIGFHIFQFNCAAMEAACQRIAFQTTHRTHLPPTPRAYHRSFFVSA